MCLTCDIVSGQVSPVGGIIYRDEYVILHHCIDINIPGYLILSPLRHAESYSDLNQLEILHMGVIIKLAGTALEKLDDVEKVYVATFGEKTTHFHLHIFPRYRWMLKQSAEDICTDKKVDGAKLFSFWRKRCQTEPDLMRRNDVSAVIDFIRNLISTSGADQFLNAGKV